MPIKVYADRIEIGAKTITTTPTGIRIGDSLAANTQQQGYIAQANFTARELAFGGGSFQGSSFGYTSGGIAPPESNVIDKFPFATNTNATDVGDLTQARRDTAGQSSTTHGYVSGGYLSPPSTRFNTIDKFLFVSDGNATDVGDLTSVTGRATGQSSSTNGYISGGNPPAGTKINTIQKFPFASDTNAVNIGVLTQARQTSAGQSSTTHGYNAGGYAPPQVNTIDKFPFVTDTNATDVGDLTQARRLSAGQSSMTHGYTSGGTTTVPQEPGLVNTIDKFPFASDTNASDVGDLSQIRASAAGQSSTGFGYTSGGLFGPPTVNLNTIDKFPFSTNANASDVGDLSQIRSSVSGQQF